jgi:periplasmic glucans biosynthesis protein
MKALYPFYFHSQFLRVRQFCCAALFACATPLALAQAAQPTAAPAATRFDFDVLTQQARTLSQSPYVKREIHPDAFATNYEQYRKIQFMESRSLWRGSAPFEMQFFPVGNKQGIALSLYELVDGMARPVTVAADSFWDGGDLSTRPGPNTPPSSKTAPVAGWRLTYPLNEPGKRDEVAAYLGASYYRALGKGHRYGTSARGLAVDVIGGTAGEEFPVFTSYWFERPAKDAKQFSFYALLDSPRVTGAYHFILKPGATTVTEVRATLFLRQTNSPITKLGVAPLSSMFLHGENQSSANGDFRPEVHDADGLQILTAQGQWIWRPLTNPAAPFVTTFTETSPRGFGLMQRDREFTNYEDIEARYELRPSAWIEPIGDWGEGTIELLQFRTPDETHDNVAAYWVPRSLPAPGTPLALAWRVHWTGAQPPSQSVTVASTAKIAAVSPAALARVVQTRTGYGYVDADKPNPAGRQKIVIDFGDVALPAGYSAREVKAVTDLSKNARIVRVHTYPNPVRGGFRTTVEFDRIDAQQGVDLRIFLQLGANTLSEIWSYALAPKLHGIAQK